MPDSVELSVVVPVHNEGAALRELAARCLAAAGRTDLVFELVIVDDASVDNTASILSELAANPAIKVRTLERKSGQFRATQEGLAFSRGGLVIVLDGDLQDPPEFIPVLVEALSGDGRDAEVVFGVKESRAEPLWFRVLRKALDLSLGLGPRPVVPGGAGSYCLMRREVAVKVAGAPVEHANLAVVAALACRRWSTAPYRKAERRDGASRVGLLGLAREALATAALSGALPRLLAVAAAVIAAAGVFLIAGTCGGLLAETAGSVLMAAGCAVLYFSGVSGWNRFVVRTKMSPAVGMKSRWNIPAAILHPGLWLPVLAPVTVSIFDPTRGFLGLNLLAVILAVILAVRFAWINQRVRRAVAAVLLWIACVVFVGVFVLSPKALPADWITILHEGSSDDNVRMLFGTGAHAGWNFHQLVLFFTGGAAGDGLKGVVYFNLVMGAINGAVFLVIAWGIIRNRLVLAAIVIAFVHNRYFIMASLSEIPAQLLFAYFFMAILAVAATADSNRMFAGLAVIFAGLLGTLSVGSREEFGVIWAPALIAMSFKGLPGWKVPGWISSGLSEFAGKLIGGPKSLAFSILLLVIVFVGIGDAVFGEIGGTAFLLGGIFEAPVYLATMVPLGIFFLIVAGFWFTLKRPAEYLFLPVTLLVVMHIYMTRGTFGAPYERFRYMTKLFPAVMVLSLFGWQWFENAIMKVRNPDRWRKVAIFLLFWSLIPNQNMTFFLFRGYDGWSWIPDLDTQVEVRSMVDYLDRHPNCLFVTRVHEDSSQRGKHSFILFKKGRPDWKTVPDDGSGLKGVLAAAAPAEPCVMFYRNLNCNLVGEDDCAPEVKGNIVMDERTFTSRPYVDAEEYGKTKGVITLGLYRVVR